MSRYAFTVPTSLEPAAAVERVTALLAAEGFGILTRIDVHEVLQKKLGVTRAPYVILGACNPHFAQEALALEPEIGILLPCNVVVEGVDRGSRVHITDPEALFSLVDRPGGPDRPDRPGLAAVMAQVRERLVNVARALEAPG